MTTTIPAYGERIALKTEHAFLRLALRSLSKRIEHERAKGRPVRELEAAYDILSEQSIETFLALETTEVLP